MFSFKKYIQIDEGKDSFIILYRVNRGGELNPWQSKSYSRGGGEETTGVFLSKDPTSIATHHGITSSRSGNVNSYRVHQSIKKAPGVKYGVYDNAWEIFIPSEVWEQFKQEGLIEYLGHSNKDAEGDYRQFLMSRANNQRNFLKRVKRDIELNPEKIKKFIDEKRKLSVEFSPISAIQEYYKFWWPLDAVKSEIETILRQHSII